jgi:transcriptional regulator with XRE-family HTH domain
MFNSEKLAEAIKEKRGVKPKAEISLRRATEEIKSLGGEMNLTTLQRMEQGNRTPTPDNLHAVCKWLGVPMETFFTEQM